jgi:RNA polymerase sigma-54 factor
MLSAQGIPVARRTVAKYREALGIAPSGERKRDGSR